MIHLDYNSTKTVTFYLQPSLIAPTYLLSLVNYTTRKRKSFIAPDLSGTSNLLQFSITEVGTGAESLLNGGVSITDFGKYTFEVYEQVSTTNLDVSLATKLGDDEVSIHKDRTLDAPPPRNEIEEESICALSSSTTSTPETILGNDGTATATAINGVGAITYLWNDSLNQTTQVATGLSPGFYLVIISDDTVGGCTSSSTIEVLEYIPTPTCNISIDSITVTTETSLGAGNGTATAVISGNTGAVNFIWGNNESTVNPATTLSAGSSSLAVSDGGVGVTCLASKAYEIILNKCLRYDSINDYSQFDSAIPIAANESYTFSFEVELASAFNGRIIVGSTATHLIGIDTTGNKVEIRHGGTTRKFFFPSIVSGAFCTVSGGRDENDDLRVWINGIESTSGAIAETAAVSFLRIGYLAAAFLPARVNHFGLSPGIEPTTAKIAAINANPENYLAIVGGGTFYDMNEDPDSLTATDRGTPENDLNLINFASNDHFTPVL